MGTVANTMGMELDVERDWHVTDPLPPNPPPASAAATDMSRGAYLAEIFTNIVITASTRDLRDRDLTTTGRARFSPSLLPDYGGAGADTPI